MTSIAAAAPIAPSPWKARLVFALKLAITAGAFSFILTRTPVTDLLRAVTQISLFSVLAAVSLQFVALAVGTLRWQMLMHAYGAVEVPSFVRCFKVYLVGYFYNTYLPGAVGGDVVRGIVTRKAFGDSGTMGAMAVVFVERALGLAGVMGLTAIATSLYAAGRFGANVLPYTLLAIAAVGALLAGVGLGRKLARFVPGPLGRILGSLPELTRVGPFAVTCVLSLLTHVLVSLCGHVLIASIDPKVALTDSLLAMPLAGAAGYFPFTIAGAGARDAALVSLYEALGVPRAAGVATALAYLFSSLLTAAVGGIVQLLAPLTKPADERE